MCRVSWMIVALASLAGSAVGQIVQPPAKAPAAAPILERQVTPLAHIEKRGAGPIPVVLIPDMYFDWTVFETFMDRNSDRYTMYAVTLPGFGGSEPPPLTKDDHPGQQVLLRNAAAAIAQLIRDEGLTNPVLVGHGMGGNIAMRVAIADPAAVGRLITINSTVAVALGSPNAATPLSERAQFVQDTIAPKLWKTPQREWNLRNRSMLTAAVKDAYRAHQLATIAESVPLRTGVLYNLEMFSSDLSPEITRIQAPTLVIACIPDLEHPMTSKEQIRESVRQQHTGIPGGEIVFVEDTRHFIMDDEPARFDTIVESFASGESVEGAQDL